MLTSVCVIPATPLLVEQVGGAAASEVAGLRARVVAAAEGMAERAQRWLVVGPGEPGDGEVADAVGPWIPPSTVGTFSGFGPDVRVSLAGQKGGPGSAASVAASPSSPSSLSAQPARADQPDATMSLPLLIAGWLRQAVRADLRPSEPIIGVRAGVSAPPERCAGFGAELRAELDAAPERTGILVVGDGPTTLTAKAPGAYDPRALPMADSIARAIAKADRAALARLDPASCSELGVDGRAPWQVVAAVLGDDPVRVVCASSEWPYGVGYHRGLWLVGEEYRWEESRWSVGERAERVAP